MTFHDSASLVSDNQIQLSPSGSTDSELPSSPLSFQDITDSTNFQPQFEFPLWALSLIIVTAILLAIVLYFVRKSKKTPASAPNYYLEALQKLPLIREHSSKQSIAQTASSLSVLVRGSLEKNFSLPALYQTKKEFSNSDYKQLPDEVSQLLHTLWELEYARPAQNSSDSPTDILNRTESLLKKLSQS